MLSRLCGQVSEAVKIAGVEHRSGNGDEGMNLRKALMAIVP